MKKEIIELGEDLSHSPLYSKDLAPVPPSGRTWNKWNLAAIWVGMAVCIPTYILASYMIKTGLSWQASLLIIGLANLVITVPMVLNGHAGVKYGIPFPVIGRAAFGTKGIHIPSIVRGIVACGWFGVQTWIGGLAFYSIWNVISGQEAAVGLDAGKFVCFVLFWFVNIYFIWKGTESIKWLEDYSAPILIIIGIVLIAWGYRNAGSFSGVLAQGEQLQKPTATAFLSNDEASGLSGTGIRLNPLKGLDGSVKASEFMLRLPLQDRKDSYHETSWTPVSPEFQEFSIPRFPGVDMEGIRSGDKKIQMQMRAPAEKPGEYVLSGKVDISMERPADNAGMLWSYILWFTAMVGFWATMSLSIADITRFAKSQKDQVSGQFIGLPGTMIFYSFVGIFVTCAAVVSFKDVLIAEDAPWDPVTLIAKFNSPLVVIFAQIAMLIATLSTNIAANVIAPANAFSNVLPKKISFRAGGIITGLVGIVICPWWLMDEISNILIFVSGLLGPVLGILLSDYYLVRRSNIELAELYKADGKYSYGGSGFNRSALITLLVSTFLAVIGKWVPSLSALYSLSWFTGFIVSFFLYYALMKTAVRTAVAKEKVNV